jgi:uncharacterized protein (DUF697 family)
VCDDLADSRHVSQTAIRASLRPTKVRAMECVRFYCAVTAGAAVVPAWWISSPTVAAVQLKMLAELSQLYRVDFAQDVTRPILASLSGGGLSMLLSRHPASLVLKSWVVTIPVIGVPLRFGAGPAILAGYTYLLGRAFTQHYDTGGTYLSFDYKRLVTGMFESVRTAA